MNVDGDAVIGGNLTFGDADTDSVSFGAEISSSIVPDADSSYDIGSSSKNWRFGYIEQLSATHISASGNISGSVSSTGSFGALVNTGEVSATHLTGSFSGSFAGQIGARHIHNQDTTATTWSITHNLGHQYPNVTVYDSNDIMVLPTSVTATNTVAMSLTFSSAVAGQAMLGLGGAATDGNTFVHNQSSTSVNWRVTHSLG